jgi:hypothetical protein
VEGAGTSTGGALGIARLRVISPNGGFTGARPSPSFGVPYDRLPRCPFDITTLAVSDGRKSDDVRS